MWIDTEPEDYGALLVSWFAAAGASEVQREDFDGKIDQTFRLHVGTSAECVYVNADGHQAYLHRYKDSDDVLVSFLRWRVAAFVRGASWIVVSCLLSNGYRLHEPVSTVVSDAL